MKEVVGSGKLSCQEFPSPEPKHFYSSCSNKKNGLKNKKTGRVLAKNPSVSSVLSRWLLKKHHTQMNPETTQIGSYSIFAVWLLVLFRLTAACTLIGQEPCIFTKRERRCPHWQSALHSCIVRARLCKNMPNIIKLLSFWAGNNYRINIKRYKIPWRTGVLYGRSALVCLPLFYRTLSCSCVSCAHIKKVEANCSQSE